MLRSMPLVAAASCPTATALAAIAVIIALFGAWQTHKNTFATFFQFHFKSLADYRDVRDPTRTYLSHVRIPRTWQLVFDRPIHRYFVGETTLEATAHPRNT